MLYWLFVTGEGQSLDFFSTEDNDRALLRRGARGKFDISLMVLTMFSFCLTCLSRLGEFNY